MATTWPQGTRARGGHKRATSPGVGEGKVLSGNPKTCFPCRSQWPLAWPPQARCPSAPCSYPGAEGLALAKVLAQGEDGVGLLLVVPQCLAPVLLQHLDVGAVPVQLPLLRMVKGNGLAGEARAALLDPPHTAQRGDPAGVHLAAPPAQRPPALAPGPAAGPSPAAAPTAAPGWAAAPWHA